MSRFYISQLLEFLSILGKSKSKSRLAFEVLKLKVDSPIAHGFVPSFDDLIEISEALGFVSLAHDSVSLTKNARAVLSSGTSSVYNLTNAQKGILAMSYLGASGKLGSRVRKLLTKLVYVPIRSGFEMDMRVLAESEYELAYVFISLGVLEETEGKLVLASNYHDYYKKEIMPGGRYLPNERLEEMLLAQRRIGAKAEEIVKAYEQDRLRKMGRYFEAEAVRQISLENVAAGYDIESFDGCEPAVESDRFIEVKGSRAYQISFFLTRNEYIKAEQLKEKYWLYFVSPVGPKLEPKILLIQNLHAYLNKGQSIKFEPVCWHLIISSPDMRLNTHKSRS